MSSAAEIYWRQDGEEDRKAVDCIAYAIINDPYVTRVGVPDVGVYVKVDGKWSKDFQRGRSSTSNVVQQD